MSRPRPPSSAPTEDPGVPEGMRRALVAARRGVGRVSPNPAVGAVWRAPTGVWTTGFHAVFGGPHAEVALLGMLEASEDAAGPLDRGELYLTLEPCSHRGKTPPCVDRVLAARPSRIWIATPDPNPLVSGKGIARLRRAGIPVDVGVAAEAAVRLNLPFFANHLWGRAWVHLKLGASLDGKLATEGGEVRWITGERSRRDVHRARSRVDAVVIGSGTAQADDPELTVRHVNGPEPSKIVIDSRFRTDPRAHVQRIWKENDVQPVGPDLVRGNHVRTPEGWRRRPRLVLAGGRGGDPRRVRAFREAGWEVWLLPLRRGRISLRAFVRRAAREGLPGLYVEAGPGLAGAFLTDGLVDELTIYQSPSILGGGRGWTGSYEAGSLAGAVRLELRTTRRLGADLRIDFERPGAVEEFLRCSPGWSRSWGSSSRHPR